MWGRLPLAGLLLAGCAFDPGGSSSESDADASPGSPDARRDSSPSDPDAAPVPPDAAPVEPVLLDTLTIQVADTDPVESSVVLVAGQTYRLVASGTATVRDDEAGRYTGDADYWWGGIFLPTDSFDNVDMGLAVNDTDGMGSRSPDWGDYAGSHVYQATIQGNDQLAAAVYFDPDYENGNSGSLTLEIWGPPP